MRKLLIIPLIISTGFSVTLDENPLLKSLNSQIKSKYSNIKYSNNLKNPILTIGVTNFQDDFKRDKEAMQSQFILFSQEFETNKKRNLKRDISTYEYKIYQNKWELEKIKIFIKLNKLHYKLANLKKEHTLLNKYIENMKELIKNAEQSYSLGNFSKVKLSSLELSLLKLNINKKQLINKIDNLKKEISKISSIQILTENLTYSKVELFEIFNHIELKLIDSKINKQNSILNLSKENIYPNFKLNAGYYQRENREDYVNFSVSIPLPIYNSEREKIVEEKYKLLSIKNLKEDILLKLNEDKNILLNNINTSSEIINNLIEIIKKQEKIIEETKNNYENNNNSILSIFKEKNKLFKVKIELLKEQNNYENYYNELKYYKEIK